MKLIKALNKRNYINIDYIQYIYVIPIEGKSTYYVSVGTNKNTEISEETYNYLINNYSL